MKLFRGPLPKGSLLALLLFGISLLATVFAYAHLKEVEKSTIPFIQAFKLGTAKNIVLSHAKCVGSFTRNLKRDEKGHELEIEGVIHSRLAAKKYKANLDFEAHFNGLGQMGGALLRVNVGDVKIVFGSTSINPLIVIFTANFGKKKFNFRKEIPGPVELLKNSDGTFSLHYRPLKLPGLVSYSLDQQPLYQLLQLSFKEASQEDELCSQKFEDLDLNPLWSRVKPFVNRIQQGSK